jgi:hypothetical protein
MIEFRWMTCPGPCGEEKLLEVAVVRNGMGHEVASRPRPCRECQLAALGAARASA